TATSTPALRISSSYRCIAATSWGSGGPPASIHFSDLRRTTNLTSHTSRQFLFSQRQQREQTGFPQATASPHQHPKIDRKENKAKERVANTHLHGDSAAEISRQQDRAQHSGARKDIEHGADKQ